MSNNPFCDKTILITGIGGGIGNAIISHYLPKAKNIITASRTPFEVLMAQLEEEKTSLTKPSFPNHIHYMLDLTVEANVIDLFQKIKQNYAQLDIMINTIGGSLHSDLLENFELAEFNKIMTVNLTSAFLLTREAIKTMKLNAPYHGNIVHFVSSASKRGGSKKGPYAIAKAGLIRLIQYAAEENASYNIKINGINPTYVLTARHRREIQEIAQKKNISVDKIISEITASQLLKRPLLPEDLIPFVELLASTETITGQILDATMGEIIS